MKKAAMFGALCVLLVVSAVLLLQQISGTDPAQPTILAEMPPTASLSPTASLPPTASLSPTASLPPTPTLPPFTRIAEVEAGEGPVVSWRPSRMEGLDPLSLLMPLDGKQLFFDGKDFILVFNDRFFTSPDGDVWGEIPLQIPNIGRSWIDIAVWDDLIVVSSARPEVITFEKSSSSITRFLPDFPYAGITNRRSGLAVGPRGAVVVFFSSNSSSIYVLAAYASPNGRDWTQIEAKPFKSQFGGVAAIGEGFLYRERNGPVWFSTDGLTWTDRFAGDETVFTTDSGFAPWKDGVLVFPDNVFLGPTISNGPYTFLDINGKHILPLSDLPPLEGTYLGIGGGVSAGSAGILGVFGWDPHIYVRPPGGCCQEGQALGVVEFSADGTTWTRRQFSGDLFYFNGTAAGTDRFLVLGFSIEADVPTPHLWIGFP